MIPILCLVQEGQIDAATGDSLKASLSQLSQATYGAEASINWVEVGEGNGFTEAKPSHTSLVSVQSDRPLSREERMSVMTQICDFWIEQTHCSINEIVAAVNDPAS